MSHHLLANMHRPLSHGGVETHCALDGLRRRLRSSDYLDQRNQVRRIEGMSGYATLRVLALRLDAAHRDTGSTRRQDGRRWKDQVDVREQFDLKSLAFWSVFLHHVRAFKCFFETRFK